MYSASAAPLSSTIIAAVAGVAEESSHESITRVTEERVDKVVKSIVRKLRRAPSQKWNDPDFGPDDVDNLGAKSLYKNGNPPSAGYPSASSLRWERPVYACKRRRQ